MIDRVRRAVGTDVFGGACAPLKLGRTKCLFVGIGALNASPAYTRPCCALIETPPAGARLRYEGGAQFHDSALPWKATCWRRASGLWAQQHHLIEEHYFSGMMRPRSSAGFHGR